MTEKKNDNDNLIAAITESNVTETHCILTRFARTGHEIVDAAASWSSLLVRRRQ